MRGVAAAILMGLAMTGGGAAGAAAQTLEGVWVATAAERDGAPAPDIVGHRLTVAGARFEIAGTDGALLYGGGFVADPAASPATIDFAVEEGLAAGQSWLGVWRIDGGGLMIVDNAPDPSRPRPEAFAAPAGSGYVAVTFAPAG
jgi:uncharacterized protein (TIGR03067 family)